MADDFYIVSVIHQQQSPKYQNIRSNTNSEVLTLGKSVLNGLLSHWLSCSLSGHTCMLCSEMYACSWFAFCQAEEEAFTSRYRGCLYYFWDSTNNPLADFLLLHVKLRRWNLSVLCGHSVSAEAGGVEERLRSECLCSHSSNEQDFLGQMFLILRLLFLRSVKPPQDRSESETYHSDTSTCTSNSSISMAELLQSSNLLLCSTVESVGKFKDLDLHPFHFKAM